MADDTLTASAPTGVHHVRLTVTDIAYSKDFYRRLLGVDPVVDFSDQIGDPTVHDDPARLYGGCAFPVGEQLVGLRPVAAANDRFDSTRVGLDHLSLTVQARDDLERAAERLADAGIEHGEITELPDLGMVILSLQDPDDNNLELCYLLPDGDS